MSVESHPKCGCDLVCGDLPEEEDDPMAICKQLPMPTWFDLPTDEWPEEA